LRAGAPEKVIPDPTDKIQPVGAPVIHPTDEDLSMGAPVTAQ